MTYFVIRAFVRLELLSWCVEPPGILVISKSCENISDECFFGISLSFAFRDVVDVNCDVDHVWPDINVPINL